MSFLEAPWSLINRSLLYFIIRAAVINRVIKFIKFPTFHYQHITIHQVSVNWLLVPVNALILPISGFESP